MSTNQDTADQDAADPAAALREEEPAAAGAEAAGADDAAGGDEPGAGERDWAAEAAALEAEVAELKDQLLRRQADFENFRKRQHLKRDEEILNARKAILLDVADVIDDLERALQTGQDTEKAILLDVERALQTAPDADAAALRDDMNVQKKLTGLRDGVSSIEKKLTGVLDRKWGFRRFSSKGEPFDPERHQAIATEDSGAHEAATVVEDYQSGYLLHDHVVRTARVKVAQPLGGSNEGQARAPGDASADTKEGT